MVFWFMEVNVFGFKSRAKKSTELASEIHSDINLLQASSPFLYESRKSSLTVTVGEASVEIVNSSSTKKGFFQTERNIF